MTDSTVGGLVARDGLKIGAAKKYISGRLV
jgi:hypothetical protein